MFMFRQTILFDNYSTIVTHGSNYQKILAVFTLKRINTESNYTFSVMFLEIHIDNAFKCLDIQNLINFLLEILSLQYATLLFLNHTLFAEYIHKIFSLYRREICVISNL